MKVLKSIIIVAVLALSFTAKASNDDNKVQNRVATALSQTDTDVEGAVNVKFTLEANGTVNVVSIESNTDGLKEVVASRLNELRIKNAFSKQENVYNMNFIFHQEEK